MVFGIWACSTSVIFVKASSIHPVLLGAYRLLVGGVILSPLFLRDLRRYRSTYGLRHIRRTILPGIFLAAHFALWILGARLTAAAHATLIVNTVPIVMPFLLYFVVREKVTRGEVIGTILALMGVGLLSGTDLHTAREFLAGDVICFASMLMLASYMVLGRRNRDFPTIWLYVTPVYLVAGVLSLAAGLGASLIVDVPIALESPRQIWFILGLGIIPTVIGQSIINYSLKHLRGQLVSVATLGEFLFAGIMAYFLLREVPSWCFYPAAVLVAAGVLVAVRATPEPTLRAELTEAPPD
jgi:drug/metabolite transporter (DMT)-like permease